MFSNLTAQLPARGQHLDAAAVRDTKALLVRQQVALDTIRTGGGLRRSRYPVDFRFEGPQPPQLRPLRQATFLLLMEAMVNREESRPHDAAASLITCCRLTESLKNEPIIMSHAVRSIGQSLIVRRLEWLLNVSTLPPDDLETFASALAGATDTAALHRALATALCQGSDCFRQISSGKFRMSDAVDLVPPRPWWFTPAGYIYEAAGRVPSDWLTFLELQYAAIGAANCPLPDRLRASEDLAEQMHALSRWRLPVRLFLIGSSPELIKRDLARIALVESARTALVIEQHRDPAEIPTDPFDGRPLRYKKLPNGYVVYSVGEDGKDDGGDETKDITFTVER